jgi:hypothetical protein
MTKPASLLGWGGDFLLVVQKRDAVIGCIIITDKHPNDSFMRNILIKNPYMYIIWGKQ